MESYPVGLEDVPASQIYLGKDVRKHGMLRKKSGGLKLFRNKYDLRYVIINKGWVYYYVDRTSLKPQGSFSLQDFSKNVVTAEEEEATMHHVFKLYSKKANERIWYFATKDEAEKKQWMEAFRDEIERYNVPSISNINRPSQTWPNKQQTRFPYPDDTDTRSRSVNKATPMPNPLSPHLPLSYSNTTMESGIGSSTMSLSPSNPDETYETLDEDSFDDCSDDDYPEPIVEEVFIKSHPPSHFSLPTYPKLPPRDPSPSRYHPHSFEQPPPLEPRNNFFPPQTSFRPNFEDEKPPPVEPRFNPAHSKIASRPKLGIPPLSEKQTLSPNSVYQDIQPSPPVLRQKLPLPPKPNSSVLTKSMSCQDISNLPSNRYCHKEPVQLRRPDIGHAKSHRPFSQPPVQVHIESSNKSKRSSVPNALHQELATKLRFG